MKPFKFLSDNKENKYHHVYNEGWDMASMHIETNPVRRRFSVWDMCPYEHGTVEYEHWELGYDNRWWLHEESMRALPPIP
jgi:hypothetical protein